MSRTTGYVPGLLQAAHPAHDVEAAGAGHVDVEQEHADVAAQQLLERLVAAGGPAQRLSERGQGALQREQRVLVVVDEEDAGGGRHGARPSSSGPDGGSGH
ncbi:hypothetical protein RKD47_004846 [Streptomyces albogriseolus]